MFDLIDDIFISLSGSYCSAAKALKCADVNVPAEGVDGVCCTRCHVINSSPFLEFHRHLQHDDANSESSVSCDERGLKIHQENPGENTLV